MRDELFVRLGKRCVIDIGQVEGERVAIGTWNGLLSVFDSLLHDARETEVDGGRAGRGFCSRLYVLDPKWDSEGTLSEVNGTWASMPIGMRNA